MADGDRRADGRALHGALPTELRSLPPELLGDSRWLYLVVVTVLLGVIIVGDPGRIDRQDRWLRAVTIALIALISADNALEAGRLVVSILSTKPFTEDANKLLIAGGPSGCPTSSPSASGTGRPTGRSRGPGPGHRSTPAFVFPEMINPQFVGAGWYPQFVDYLHLSFTAATAFSPTDVSPVKAWASS